MANLTVDSSGRIMVGLDRDWNPVPIERAVLVKLIEPDGTVRFLKPVRKETRESPA